MVVTFSDIYIRTPKYSWKKERWGKGYAQNMGGGGGEKFFEKKQVMMLLLMCASTKITRLKYLNVEY